MAEAHPLMLYNTLTRRKEVFVPLDAQNVRMYVCGPTVYDYAHIGNARPVIVFDVLFRLLRQMYGDKHVTYVRNITDVDDKINARAAEEGRVDPRLTERTAKQFHADIKALGVLPPTVEPRATEHIEEMKALIEALIANGNAYVAEGHVLFHVPRCPTTAACLTARWTRWRRAPASRWRPTRETRWTSCCGSRQSPASRRGLRRPASRRRAVRAGTSSARPWPRSTSARCSTSTAAASTSSSRTTRTRSRSRAARIGTPVMAQLLAAQRLPAGRRREDVEVARQLHHHPRPVEGLAG